MAYATVRVVLSDIETDDLVEELEERGLFVIDEDVNYLKDIDIQYDILCEKLENIYNLRSQGLPYQKDLDSLFEDYLGL